MQSIIILAHWVEAFPPTGTTMRFKEKLRITIAVIVAGTFTQGSACSQLNLEKDSVSTSAASTKTENNTLHVLEPEKVEDSHAVYIRFKKYFSRFWRKEYGRYYLRYQDPIPLYSLKSNCKDHALFYVALGELETAYSKRRRTKEPLEYSEGYGLQSDKGLPFVIFMEEKKPRRNPRFVPLFHSNMVEIVGVQSNYQGGVNDCPMWDSWSSEKKITGFLPWQKRIFVPSTAQNKALILKNFAQRSF